MKKRALITAFVATLIVLSVTIFFSENKRFGKKAVEDQAFSNLDDRSLVEGMELQSRLLLNPDFTIRKRVYEKLVEEENECSAYFTLMSYCLGGKENYAHPAPNDEVKNVIQKAEAARDNATKSLAIFNTVANTSLEFLKHDFEASLMALAKEMGDCNNLQRLIDQKGLFCKALLEDPYPRLAYWEERLKK